MIALSSSRHRVLDPIAARSLRAAQRIPATLALTLGCGLLLASAPSAVAGPVGFFDINPDNEAADSLVCQPGDPCTSQQNGGRVNGLAVVPDAPDIYFAASEAGGLFKSTKGGASWVHIDGYVPATAWDVAAEPGGQRVFATSLNEGRQDTQAVLQVSTDGGVTWSGRLPAPPPKCSDARAQQPSGFGIALRPGTSDVFAGTNCGLALSNDAGDHWTRFDPTPDNAPSHIWDVVALPGGRTYACGDDGLLTSSDGQPAPWDKLGTPPLFPGGLCSLAVSPDDPSVVFVAFGRPTFFGDALAVGCCNFPLSGGGPEFYEGHVDLGGATPTVQWTQLPYPDDIGDPTPNTITKKGRIPFVVTNKRSQGFDLWLGDGSLWRVPCSAQQSPSCPIDTTKWSGSYTDHLGGPNGAHGDSGDLEFDPSNGCPTLYSSDGGIYSNSRRQDPSMCHDDPVFVGENVGLHAFLLWDMEGVGIPGVDGEDIYFATQDNGLFYTSEGGKNTPSWVHPLAGDVFDVAADDTQVAVAPGGYLQAGDRGYQNPVQAIPSGLATLAVPDLIARVGSGRFMMVIPTATSWNGTPIPIGVRDITDIKNAPFGSELGSWKSTKPPCHIAVAVGPNGAQPYVLAGQCFWPNSSGGGAAAANDELWTYREVAPGVTDWTQIALPSGTGFGLIAVDPANPDRLYASVVGDQPPQMMRSNHGGTDWVSDEALTNLMSGDGKFMPYPGVVEDGLFPYLAPLLVAFDPEDPNILVAGGTYSGVFLSSNGGENWFLLTDPFTPGTSAIPHLPRPLFAHFDHDKPDTVRVYLGTGRGVWRVDLALIDVSITKLGTPDPVVTGSDITYAIEVRNQGLEPTASLKLSDDLPANVVFQSLTPASEWSCSTPPPGSAGTVSCTRSGLPAESMDTFSLVAKVDCSVADGALITNTAALATQLPDPSLNNNSFIATNRASNPPPLITCPNDVEVECTGNCGIDASDPQLEAFFAGASALDNCPGVVIINDTPAFLGLGMTTVTFTATDSGGASASCEATVNVVDTTPPEISISLSPNVLWPPNHKLVPIAARVNVTDVCDPNATFVLTSISSNEPDNGTGDGDTPDDIQGEEPGTADTTFQLRSERSGLGSGRIYTIVYTATDKSGNTAQATAIVTVPHDQTGHASGGAGFNSLGTGLIAKAQTFELVVVSTSEFDAWRIDPARARVGNATAAIDALRSRVTDVNGDQWPDMILTYSIAAAQGAQAASGDTLAFRYGTVDGSYYLVSDIFSLGRPVKR